MFLTNCSVGGMPRAEKTLIQSTNSISMSQVRCPWACKWETPRAACLAWKWQRKVVLSTVCFLAVAPKLGFFWLLKSAIAAARALLLTMVARCREMGAQKVGGGRISAVVVWWRGHLNAPHLRDGVAPLSHQDCCLQGWP